MSPTLLAACGSSSKSSSGTQTTGGAAGGGDITVLTWPFYIENDDPKNSPTLIGFTKETGTAVDWKADIDGNESFFTKYGDTLTKHQDIGADIMVLTSWAAAQAIEQGWAQPFDSTVFPNKTNVVDYLANPSWDPNRAQSIPWAIGQTGYAYWPDKVGGEITDVNAIFDPKYKGKVTVLDEMRDTVGFALLSMGVDPSTATMTQMTAAVDKVAKARDAGQFRKIVGNSYTEDLDLGDTWIAVAWSGDAYSLMQSNSSLAWVIPQQGGMLWADNALIPAGASNPAGAESFLNYVYQPQVAGPLYETIAYIPPVKGATDHMDPSPAEKPFVEPPATPPLYEFPVLSAADTEQLSRAFVTATQQ
jgi:spermidine/putrescine transport system substrate-binding protein